MAQAQVLGQRGCLNADLEIAQAQTLAFEITHEDLEGHPIDHSGESAWCRMQRKNCEDIVLDSCVDMADADQGKIAVRIPGSTTATIKAGSWVWDLFVGDVRLAYGNATVYDSYAKDGE